jgi:hypothetical protein
MAIDDRNLAPGTKLVARYKGKEHTAEVVETEAGLRYRVADGREFKSPSSAGSAVMGGSACNGWRFWSVAGNEPEAKPKKAARKAKKNGSAGDGLLVRGEEEGRWLCVLCEESFDAPPGVEPLGCPKGHTAEDFKAS